MIQRWFDPRGAIGRDRFFADTAVTWLIGNLGFLAYFLVKTPIYSFAAYGRLLDHRSEALDAMNQALGTPWALLALALWLAQIWALTALSSKRLHDLGQGGWLAGLSLVPGVQIVFWLTLSLWPTKSSSSAHPA